MNDNHIWGIIIGLALIIGGCVAIANGNSDDYFQASPLPFWTPHFCVGIGTLCLLMVGGDIHSKTKERRQKTPANNILETTSSEPAAPLNTASSSSKENRDNSSD